MNISVEKRFLSLLLALAIVFLLLPLTPIEAAAAVNDTTSISGLTIKSNGNYASINGTTLTIECATEKDACGNVKNQTETVTFTNKSGSKATLSFGRAVTISEGTITYNDKPDNSGGTYSVSLENGGTLKITATTSSTQGDSIKLVLSNITLRKEQLAEVTFKSALNGTYTVDGQPMSEQSTTMSKVSTETFAVSATPNSDYEIVGWYNETAGEYISYDRNTNLPVLPDAVIYPVFYLATYPLFGVGEKNEIDAGGSLLEGSTKIYNISLTSDRYDDLNKAIAAAASSSTNKTIVLCRGGTLPAGNYIIPSGVTLLIPFDKSNSLYEATPSRLETYTAPSPYITLTMARGANLTINGSLNVGGSQSGRYPNNGFVTGPVGFINMAADSNISIENGGTLYAWGYITGEGGVEAKSGATVYESFQVGDYRGGDDTSSFAQDTTHGVFPMSQYYVQNIEVPLTLNAGSKEYAYMSTNVSYAGMQGGAVPVISGKNDGAGAMFRLTSGYIVKDFDESTGRLKFKVAGDVSVSEISISMKISSFGNTTIDSANFNLPIPGHMTVDATTGNVTLAQDLVLLPGSELYIRNGVTCTLGDGVRIVVFDADQWGPYTDSAGTQWPGCCGATNAQFIELPYAPGRPTNVFADRTKDALVCVDGTIDASRGAVYTTAGGANIYSTGKGIVMTVAGTETVTYQILQNINSNKDDEFVAIAIAPAVLQNGNTNHSTTSTSTATTATTYYYNTDCNMWVTHGADKHAEVIDAAVAPTCMATGLTEGKHCSVCGAIIVKQEVVPVVDHDYTGPAKDNGNGTHDYACVYGCGNYGKTCEHTPSEAVKENDTAPTCTDAGHYDSVVRCTVCNAEISRDTIETDPATGHTAGETVVENNKAPTCTAEGSYDNVVYCSTCGAELSRTTVTVPVIDHTEGEVVKENIVAPTCTEDGSHDEATYCTVCNKELTRVTKTDEKLGHKEGAAVEENRVNATCTADGSYDIVVYCTECDAELSRTSVTVDALNHNYESVVTSPTCTEKGYTTHTCSRCGDSYTDSETEATGHHFEHGVCVDGDVKLGDSNGDGDITTADVTILNAFILGKVELDEEELILLDINGDGKITTADVALLNAINKGKIQL